MKKFLKFELFSKYELISIDDRGPRILHLQTRLYVSNHVFIWLISRLSSKYKKITYVMMHDVYVLCMYLVVFSRKFGAGKKYVYVCTYISM